MSNPIRTPSKEQMDARLARFAALQPMTTAGDLAWVPQGAMDVVGDVADGDGSHCLQSPGTIALLSI